MLAALALRTGRLPFGFNSTFDFTTGATFTVPTGVTSVRLLMAAPGAPMRQQSSGTFGSVLPTQLTLLDTTPTWTITPGGGGGGGLIWFTAVTVTPGNFLSATPSGQSLTDNTLTATAYSLLSETPGGAVDTIATVNTGRPAGYASGATQLDLRLIRGGAGGGCFVSGLTTISDRENPSVPSTGNAATYSGLSGTNTTPYFTGTIPGTIVNSFMMSGGAGGYGTVIIPSGTGAATVGGRGGVCTAAEAMFRQFDAPVNTGVYGGGGGSFHMGCKYNETSQGIQASKPALPVIRIYYNTP